MTTGTLIAHSISFVRSESNLTISVVCKSLPKPASSTQSAVVPPGQLLCYLDGSCAIPTMVVLPRRELCHSDGGGAMQMVVMLHRPWQCYMDGGCAMTIRR